jgi:fatty-acyl-CoA synthase
VPDDLHTLGRWTRDRAIATPERTAIDDRGVIVTYRELEERAAALAQAFRASGYRVGDRVATLTGNSADHVVLFFACAKAGLVLVPLSWRLSAREVAEQVELAQPAVLLVEDEFATLAARALDRLGERIPTAGLGALGVERMVPVPARPSRGEDRPVRDDDPLLIVFTSGTLAHPKGAVLTHANCFWTNLSLSRTAEITSRDVVLAVLPQFHVGGWNIQPLLAIWMGATIVLERTFDAARVLQLIATRRITTMMGVPAHYQLLAQHPGFDSSDLSSLSHAIVGGAPMPEPLLRVWHGRGVALQQGYGLTEASPNVLCLPDEHASDHIGSAGKPYPHVEVAVADIETGEFVDGPGAGELLVSGPGVFAGYFRDADSTAAVMRGGWLATGDVVHRDADGFYRVVDRLRDLIISGGESIAPAEIESVLRGHPAVADAAVAGVPDETWGERPVAWVVASEGSAIDPEDLRTYCATELARFKIPREFVVVEQIPRTSATNKVMRRVLAERWRTEHAPGGSR